MLNTRKLLYILPDAAYIAEVLPTKKAHTFSIHAFRQINGNFIDENEFIVENVKKLIHKIEPEEYHLILPDFLFTNTIIDIKETKESAVKEYLKETLLPSLDLSKETHEIDTFILTQHGGKSKVQLSALEKSLLDPIRTAAAEQKLTISYISPLSWTIKSVISLEPSLSTIQIGEKLYMALHYIGVDQTISFDLSETANIIETVKTLKGAEPNIQTMYLLTNGVVEQQIKDQLSGTLPIQQLTNLIDETEGIPSFIKQIILAGARTLDIPEQPIPRFSLGKVTAFAASAMPSVGPSEQEPESEENPEPKKEQAFVEKIGPVEEEAEVLPQPSLPMPAALPVISPVPSIATLKLPELEESPKLTQATRPIPLAISLDNDEDTPQLEEPAIVVTEETKKSEAKEERPFSDSQLLEMADTTFDSSESLAEAEIEEASMVKPPVAPKPELVPVAPVVLPSSYQAETASNVKAVSAQEDMETPTTKPQLPPRKVIKNNNDAGALLKIVVITLSALVATMVIGFGVIFGLMKLSEKKDEGLNTAPIVVESPAPVAQTIPTPAASPSAALDKTKFKILVVNATKVPGQAGKVKASLTTAGYKSVTTGNAKGTYDTEGDFLLVGDANKGNLSTLSTDSGLTLTLGTTKTTEDPDGSYDAVIVIAE